MADIHVMGLPKTVKKPRLVHLLRTVIFGKKLRCKFWIRDAFPLPNSKFQQVVVNFSKGSDAFKAIDFINDFVYFNGSEDFQLSALIGDDYVPPDQYDEPMQEEVYEEKHIGRDRVTRQSSRPKKRQARDGERSRSPHYRIESSKLDMEIELVRKQRLLVEEERKLLLEKKKLELLKEFGPSTVKEFEKYAAVVEKHTLENNDPPKPQISVPDKNKRRQVKEGLPLFVLPCRLILKEMKDVIIKYSQSNDKIALAKALRMTIRKRIAGLLQNKSFMQSGEIIQLYRETYPVDTDEKLMEQLEVELKDNVNVAEENDKATDINENSDNAQEKTEAKFLPGQSSSTDIENEDTKMKKENILPEEKEMTNFKEEAVSENLKKEENDSTDIINLDCYTRDEESLGSAEAKQSLDDMYAELDDWLEEENNANQVISTDISPEDNSTSQQENGDADLKQTDIAFQDGKVEVPEDKKD